MGDRFRRYGFIVLVLSTLFLEGCNRKTYEEVVFETLFINFLNDPDVVESLYNMEGIGSNETWPMYFDDFNFLVAPDIFGDSTRTGVIHLSSTEVGLVDGEGSLYIPELDQVISKPRECFISPIASDFENPDQKLVGFLGRKSLTNVVLGDIEKETSQTIFIQIGAPIECNDVLFQWVHLSPNGDEDFGFLITFTLEMDTYRVIQMNW